MDCYLPGASTCAGCAVDVPEQLQQTRRLQPFRSVSMYSSKTASIICFIRSTEDLSPQHTHLHEFLLYTDLQSAAFLPNI